MWVEALQGYEIREASLRERKRRKDTSARLRVSSKRNCLCIAYATKEDFLGRPWNFPEPKEKVSIQAPRRMGTRGAVENTKQPLALGPRVLESPGIRVFARKRKL